MFAPLSKEFTSMNPNYGRPASMNLSTMHPREIKPCRVKQLGIGYSSEGAACLQMPNQNSR